MSLFLVSIAAAVLFAIVDSAFFLTIQTELHKVAVQKYKFTNVGASLFLGGLSAGISAYFSGILSEVLSERYQLYRSPMINAIGIMFGTIIMLIMYWYLQGADEMKQRVWHKQIENSEEQKQEASLNFQRQTKNRLSMMFD